MNGQSEGNLFRNPSRVGFFLAEMENIEEGWLEHDVSVQIAVVIGFHKVASCSEHGWNGGHSISVYSIIEKCYESHTRNWVM